MRRKRSGGSTAAYDIEQTKTPPSSYRMRASEDGESGPTRTQAGLERRSQSWDDDSDGGPPRTGLVSPDSSSPRSREMLATVWGGEETELTSILVISMTS